MHTTRIIFEGLSFRRGVSVFGAMRHMHVCRGRCKTSDHPRGTRGILRTLLKRWQAWVKTRGDFGGHVSWQAKCLVNLDDASKGPKVLFCEAAVSFDLVHGDQLAWQGQYFGCFGLIFLGRCRIL